MSAVDKLLAIASYAIAVNLGGFLAFAWDKHRARLGLWRVSERTLLTLALVGGTVGVIFGQQLLRHKTRKEPFRTYLLLIAVIQLVVMTALLFPQTRNALWALLQHV